MSKQVTDDWQPVGAFDDQDFASTDWARAFEVVEDGTRSYYQEPGARVVAADNTLHVQVRRFDRSSSAKQTLDNAKHVYVARRTIELEPGAVVEVASEMAATRFGDQSDDYRSGFAAFNVLDEQAQLVYDTASTGARVFAVHECLADTGGFTWIIDAPVAKTQTEPGVAYTHCMKIDTRENGRAEYRVDGELLFELNCLRVVPRALRVALGLFTLLPIANGQSCSLHGQGMAGSWSNVRYRHLGPS